MYPSIGWGRHIVNYLDALSEATWVELNAYMSATGVEIPPGECRLIIRLGREQNNMMHQAKKTDCLAPYLPVGDDLEERSTVIVSSFISRFKSK